ncbi:hypothetical protein CIK74_12960 [Glutamicibacter sp. BW77]|nr:hypothetical protein CIK74_12960 [Glutamicibacter sp. BW77]
MMATGLHDVGRRLAGAGTAHADRKLKPARGTFYGTIIRIVVGYGDIPAQADENRRWISES